MDLRLKIDSLFGDNKVVEQINHNGYVHVAVQTPTGLRYGSVGEFKVFASTEERFNKVKSPEKTDYTNSLG